MAMSGGSDDGAPMMDMNMTPLIDVLLVLLIMFIITIPVATHSVDIDLPAPIERADRQPVDPIKNKIVLTPANEILWNGTPINQNQLVAQPAGNAALCSRARTAVRARAGSRLRPFGQGAQHHQGFGRHQVRLRRQREIPRFRQVS